MCQLQSCFGMLGRIGGSWGVDRGRLSWLKRGVGVAFLIVSVGLDMVLLPILRFI